MLISLSLEMKMIMAKFMFNDADQFLGAILFNYRRIDLYGTIGQFVPSPRRS